MTVKYPIDTSGDPTAVRLRATTDEGLLDAFASLTHRLHAAAARYAPMPKGCTPGEVAGIRDQRDRVRAEILRRMGDVR